MQVVDAIEIHVLSVPRKGCLPHPKIEVGGIYAFNDNPTLMLHHVQQGVQVTDVPLFHILQDKTFGRVKVKADQALPLQNRLVTRR